MIDSDITDGCSEKSYNKIWRWCASRFCKTVLVWNVDNIAISALRNLEAQLDVKIMVVMGRPSKQAKWHGISFLHRVTATLLYQACRGYDNVFWPALSHTCVPVVRSCAEVQSCAKWCYCSFAPEYADDGRRKWSRPIFGMVDYEKTLL